MMISCTNVTWPVLIKENMSKDKMDCEFVCIEVRGTALFYIHRLFYIYINIIVVWLKLTYYIIVLSSIHLHLPRARAHTAEQQRVRKCWV